MKATSHRSTITLIALSLLVVVLLPLNPKQEKYSHWYLHPIGTQKIWQEEIDQNNTMHFSRTHKNPYSIEQHKHCIHQDLPLNYYKRQFAYKNESLHPTLNMDVLAAHLLPFDAHTIMAILLLWLKPSNKVAIPISGTHTETSCKKMDMEMEMQSFQMLQLMEIQLQNQEKIKWTNKVFIQMMILHILEVTL